MRFAAADARARAAEAEELGVPSEIASLNLSGFRRISSARSPSKRLLSLKGLD